MARDFVAASSQYLANANAPVAAAPLTMACWFNPDALGSGHAVVDIADTGAGNHNFSLYLDGSGVWSANTVAALTRGGGSFSAASATTPYSAGSWQHAAAVFASSTDRSAYYNGGNKGTNATSVTPSGLNSVAVGRLNDSSPAGYMDGLLAEIAIWNVGLTDAEIAGLATGLSPIFIRPANLVFYPPIMGRASPEIDRIGGFDLTVNGAAQFAHPRIYYPQQPIIMPPPTAAPPTGAIMNQFQGPNLGADLFNGTIQ